ncbi:MAG TPA: hypothetical protein VGI99_15340 [Gemmataceae bacterium]
MTDRVSLASTALPGRWGRRVDALAILLVLLFAFGAASFVARNSDLWLHLATGRLIADGDYRFGTDPFAYTSGDRYWANHAWLFDLAAYSAFTSWGGSVLAALKAAVVAATAGLMLLAGRTRGPMWISAVCVLVGVLAMSPRLLLQPTIASLLLLAGTLCCLRAGGKALRIVPLLIAVWVNVDAWFVLGPALVGLFWLGRRIDPNPAAIAPWPKWFVPAALGACLLSPHHIFALRLPMELSPAVWMSAFRSDPRFAGVFAHPWHWGPLGAAGGYSPAAWAFFALLALGIVSFAANRPAVRSWRFAVWLPFAALAAWQVRLIPLFAIVAAPIAAINLGEIVRNGANARPGRLLAIAGVLALLTVNWFNGLAGTIARDRTPAWAVYSDPTLERAAKGIVGWRHANGIPTEARIFATHPDVGHYLAWHAPGERYFLDSRLTLFTEAADEFAALSRSTGILPEDNATPLPTDVAAILLYDSNAGRMTRALAQDRESVLRIDGTAVLLARPGSSSGARFDADRAAFGGASELPVAWTGPARLAEPMAWWQVRGGRGRAGSWEADAATVYLRLLPPPPSNSPALPLLAVRGARAGIEIDSNDPLAWLALGGGYMLLGERTWEREAGAGLSPLESIRLIQATAALTQAVLLSPDSASAHATLAQVCARQNAMDLAQRHAEAAARLIRRSEAATGESAARADALSEALLESVQEAQNRFLVRTEALAGDPLARARAAAELGLKQQAIDVLLASHPDLYGASGIGLLAELLLQTGQVQECRALLDRAELRRNPNALGNYALARKPNPDGSRPPYQLPAYDWLDLCQCAAAGRYAGAQEAIGRLCERLAAREQTEMAVVADAAGALLAMEVGLAAPPATVFGRLLNARERITIGATVAQTQTLAIARADLLTIAGVLDLERGDPRAATAQFGDALKLYSAPGFAVSKPGEALAARYDKAIRAAR